MTYPDKLVHFKSVNLLHMIILLALLRGHSTPSFCSAWFPSRHLLTLIPNLQSSRRNAPHCIFSSKSDKLRIRIKSNIWKVSYTTLTNSEDYGMTINPLHKTLPVSAILKQSRIPFPAAGAQLLLSASVKVAIPRLIDEERANGFLKACVYYWTCFAQRTSHTFPCCRLVAARIRIEVVLLRLNDGTCANSFLVEGSLALDTFTPICILELCWWGGLQKFAKCESTM